MSPSIERRLRVQPGGSIIFADPPSRCTREEHRSAAVEPIAVKARPAGYAERPIHSETLPAALEEVALARALPRSSSSRFCPAVGTRQRPLFYSKTTKEAVGPSTDFEERARSISVPNDGYSDDGKTRDWREPGRQF